MVTVDAAPYRLRWVITMPDNDIIRWHYWNTGDAAVYIVAVRVSWRADGAWCAYIGSSVAGKQREEDGVMQVRQHGEYLLENRHGRSSLNSQMCPMVRSRGTPHA